MRTSREYSGKVALVTGAARGIGLGISRRLAEEGARVLIADINLEQGLEAVQELRSDGLDADFISVDLAEAGGSNAMVDAASKLAGRVDVLVNNARSGGRLGLLEETEENWNLAMTVGLTSAFFAS